MKSSLSIWRYVVNVKVKSTVNILLIFMAFFENMNFKPLVYHMTLIMNNPFSCSYQREPILA